MHRELSKLFRRWNIIVVMVDHHQPTSQHHKRVQRGAQTMHTTDPVNDATVQNARNRALVR